MEQQNRTLSGFEVRSRRGKEPRVKVRDRKKRVPHEARTKKGNPDSGGRRQGFGAERRIGNRRKKTKFDRRNRMTQGEVIRLPSKVRSGEKISRDLCLWKLQS